MTNVTSSNSILLLKRLKIEQGRLTVQAEASWDAQSWGNHFRKINFETMLVVIWLFFSIMISMSVNLINRYFN